jgi:AbrB family looped-hinge helix DNA binding protein
MNTVQLSAKYQLVVPKNIRAKIKLAPGDVYEASLKDDKLIFVKTKTKSDKYFGSKKLLFSGLDAVDFIRKQRDEWE